MTPRQKRIVRELRDGPLTLPEVAQAAATAQFNAHAELRWLKRERLVRDRFQEHPPAHIWELTNLGLAIAWSADQLAL